MKLSEAIRNWKSNITTHMAVEYVLALRANINAFSDAAQSLEDDNAKLRELCEMAASKLDTEEADDETTSILSAMREIGIEVRG